MSGRTVRIGLTGPIGCGKSTVAGWLAALDDVIAVDADALARDVLAPGTTEVDAVYDRFGGGVRGADGSLDRAALGRIVFADPTALRDLEDIVHPAVRTMILAAVAAAEAAGARAVVIEAIKLVEGGLAELCDEVWLVACDAATQMRRLVGRGEDPADATSRITAQSGLLERARAVATRVIETSGDPATTREAVVAALSDTLAGHP